MDSKSKGHIIIIDDEANMGKILTKVLKLEGFEVEAFSHPVEALPRIFERKPDVVLSDLRMPEISGEQVLKKIRDAGLKTEVVLMTAYGTVESALECVKLGAFDYVTKPFDTRKLVETIYRAVEDYRSKEAPKPIEFSPANSSPPAKQTDMLGKSEAMEAVRAMIRKVAATDTPVLVTGESGTGKELVARAIHDASPRAKGPFVPINCASIPENLMESELFGHEKGSFTGANDSKAGLIETAEGGTLFLDEVGEMPLNLQAKLLRTLQEKEISRVGGLERKKINVRIVAATNRKLSKEVEAGSFREDLYYRLNVLAIKLPPLHKRREDIRLLANAFLQEFKLKNGKPNTTFDPLLLDTMENRPWPGNIRELRNFVERLVVLCEGDLIDQSTVIEAATGDSGIIHHAELRPEPIPISRSPEPIRDFREARDQFEAKYLKLVLRACEGNVTEAAKKAGISRRSYYEKLEKYSIDPSEYK